MPSFFLSFLKHVGFSDVLMLHYSDNVSWQTTSYWYQSYEAETARVASLTPTEILGHHTVDRLEERGVERRKTLDDLPSKDENKPGHGVRRIRTVSGAVLWNFWLVSGRTSVRLSFLFRKVVVCGRCLVTLSMTSYRNIKMALIAYHLNAEVILVVMV